MNMATEFSDILARNIVHICFGEDLSNEPIDLTVLEDGEWKPKSMPIKDSIYIIVGQCHLSFFKNIQNPINWLYPHTEYLISMSRDAEQVR